MADTAGPEPEQPKEPKRPNVGVFVVAPEPADWLGPVLEVLQARGSVEVFAPWVLPGAVVRLGRRVGFVRRREGHDLPGARGRGWFTAAELLARAFARGKTARTLANRVHMRALADATAALLLGRREAGPPRLVLAPSLGARRSFARARALGSTCVLVEDMPDLDSLVDGLDRMALAHPRASFLRNHRPRARDHARQRAERWQSDVIAVRGRVAWQRLGDAKERVAIPQEPSRATHRSGLAIAFAGPPLARCGSTQLPALLEALPGRELRVQPGPAAEPSGLLAHPRVRVDRSLDGVGVVLSLSPLESHPSAVTAALERGIPVVGTLASTGLLEPASVRAVEPGDTAATVRAIEAALAGEGPPPRAWLPPRSLLEWLD